MDHSHLRRLTRPILRSATPTTKAATGAAPAAGAPRATTAPAATGATPAVGAPRATTAPATTARPAPTTRPAPYPAARATSDASRELPASAVTRVRERRRPVTACEVCGRTLLTGETSRQIVSGDRVVEACALCAISATRGAQRAA